MRIFGSGKDAERQIAEDVRNGGQAAVKRLYDTWAGYLFAVCTRYIPDREVAGDVLQDSFMKIISNIGSFSWKGPGSLKAWMGRITANEALQYLRKNRKLTFLEYRDTLPDKLDEAAGEPDVEDVPLAEIQKMIQELPDGYRTVFNLAVFGEKSHKEIAGILGIAESTSASQFHRARKILEGKIREWKRTH